MATTCFAGAFASLVCCLLLCFDNTTVDVSASDLGDRGRPAGEVTCTIAPWEAALRHNDASPGGEHSGAYYDEVASECYDASRTQFHRAPYLGALALLLVGVGLAALLRSAHRGGSG